MQFNEKLCDGSRWSSVSLFLRGGSLSHAPKSSRSKENEIRFEQITSFTCYHAYDFI